MKLSRKKMLDKYLSRKILKALRRDSNFSDCYQIACNNSKKQPYLVGGKLFRTVVEVMYGHPARAASCDYDFATTSILKKKKKTKKKALRRGPISEISSEHIGYINETTPYPLRDVGILSYGGGSIKLSTRNGCKIDIIDISTLSTIKNGSLPNSIEGYLSSVPLSIQSLVMDIDRCEIFGSVGLNSINERFLWINNKESMKNLCKAKGWNDNGNSYIEGKAESLRFRYDTIKYKIPVAKITSTSNPFFSNTYISCTSSTTPSPWYNVTY